MSKFKGSNPKQSAFGKTTAPPPPVNTNRQSPQFSFEYMRSNSGYSVACCDNEHKASLASKLFTLSRMTWQDIQGAPRHGLGCEIISRNSFKTEIPANVPADAAMLALRYHGLSPVVGFRDGRIFHIVFLDHNFTVYNHG